MVWFACWTLAIRVLPVIFALLAGAETTRLYPGVKADPSSGLRGCPVLVVIEVPGGTHRICSLPEEAVRALERGDDIRIIGPATLLGQVLRRTEVPGLAPSSPDGPRQ